MGRDARDGEAPGHRGPLPGPHRRAGTRTDRLTHLPRRPRDEVRCHRAPGAPGARAPARAARPGCADLRAHARHPVPGGPALGGRDAARHRARGSGRRRAQRVGPALAPVPPRDHGAGHLHRAHRARAGSPRGDRVDRRLGPVGPPSSGALRPHHAGRADGVRHRRDAAGLRPDDRPTLRLPRALDPRGRARPAPHVPGLRRRADRGRVGRSDRRLGPPPAGLHHAGAGDRARRPRLHRQRRRSVASRGAGARAASARARG